MTQAAVEEGRRISRDLWPSTLNHLGILATLDWFCREFQEIYTDIHIEKQIHIREEDVPHPLKSVVYRVLQESLNNVAKHSGADLVRISMCPAGGGMEFSVEDNGRGFDHKTTLCPGTAGNGIGSPACVNEPSFPVVPSRSTQPRDPGTRIRVTWEA